MEISRLAAELQRQVEGPVSFDAGARALYAMDGSNYRQVPIGVVVPQTIEDVVAAIGVCRSFGVPVFSRGGGTSLAGQVPESNPGDKSRGAFRPGAARCGLRSNARRRSGFWSDVGTGPRDAHALYLWRNGWEQFLRCAFADGGKNRRERPGTGDSALRRYANDSWADDADGTCGKNRRGWKNRWHLCGALRASNEIREADSRALRENSTARFRIQPG